MSFVNLELITMKRYYEEQNMQVSQGIPNEGEIQKYVDNPDEAAKWSNKLNWQIFAPDDSYVDKKSWCYI